MEKAFRCRFSLPQNKSSFCVERLGCVGLVYNKALHKRTQA
ncbi:MAG: helix-turn-helix domain-containing protein [Microcystaceae cyanobacterium]